MAAKTATAKKATATFTEDEKSAMRERAKEAKAQSRRDPEAARIEGEREVLGKIAEMPGPDRVIAERLHALITEAAPVLVPRTYYGMPAYSKDGKVVCFFKPASKFGAALRHVGVRGRRDDRRRGDVPDLVRRQGAGPRGRDADRRPRSEGRQLNPRHPGAEQSSFGEAESGPASVR